LARSPAFPWHEYADPASRTRPGPRFHVRKGLSAEIFTALLLATSAARHVVDLLVLVADDAEDAQIRRSRGASS
jgi:hypothetical protein